ncbi:hypothetical protein GJAV_G00247630 [Gymnothorax javanicus]|nr:hypothetical protein GJAV_G00247630 [Gymnothorax javanicus]
MKDRLIAAVKTYPELYNPAVREYKDFNRRAVAWRSIALQLGISEEDARKKWKNLRDIYRKEYIAEEKRSGSSAEPKRTWKFMPLLQFLEPFVQGRQTCSNTGHDTGSETDSLSASEPSPHAAEVPSCSTAISLAKPPVVPEENVCGSTSGPVIPSEFPCAPTPDPCPARTKPPHSRNQPSRPKREHSELSEFEAQVMSSLSRRQDEDDYFGCSLAATLKRLSPAKKRLLRYHIEKLVYEVEFEDGQ